MNKGGFLTLVVVCSLLLSGCVGNKWTLMICETPHSSGGCDDIKYVLKDYRSQKDCMEKGIELKNEAGFECGLSCEPWGESTLDTGKTYRCEEVCNERGC